MARKEFPRAQRLDGHPERIPLGALSHPPRLLSSEHLAHRIHQDVTSQYVLNFRQEYVVRFHHRDTLWWHARR